MARTPQPYTIVNLPSQARCANVTYPRGKATRCEAKTTLGIVSAPHRQHMAAPRCNDCMPTDAVALVEEVELVAAE